MSSWQGPYLAYHLLCFVFVLLETAGKDFKTDHSTLKVILTSNGFILVPIVSVCSLSLIPTNNGNFAFRFSPSTLPISPQHFCMVFYEHLVF